MNLYVDGDLVAGWITSPTTTLLTVAIGFLIAWNIWLTYKSFVKEKEDVE